MALSRIKAAMVAFKSGVTGAVERALEAKLRELPASPTDAGAPADGTGNAATALSGMVGAKRVVFPAGRFRLASRVFAEQNALTWDGNASGTTLVVADPNTKTGIRLGAVGSDDRQMTKLANLNFESEVVDGTAIDAQAVFPLTLDTIRIYGVGRYAIKLFQMYYGRIQNLYLRDSGLTFNNVNNISIDGGDISGIDASTKFAAADSAVTLLDCDGVSFYNLTFETWRKCRALKIVDGKNISFNSVWFEANTCPEVIRLEQTTATAFNNCFLELFPAPSASFIGVDNSNTIGVVRKLRANVNVRGGHLRLPPGLPESIPFMNVAAGSKGSVTMRGTTLCSGHIFGRGDAVMNIGDLTLSSTTETTDYAKSLYSTPNAVLLNNYNSWCVGSVQADWDFATGHKLTEVGTTALTFATTSADGMFTTGSRGIQVSGIPSNGTDYVINRTLTEMGPVTVNGETHLVFVRLKPSADMRVSLAIEGFYMEYDKTPVWDLLGGLWYDVVFKTASDNTWAQGTQGTPKLHIKCNNSSGSATSLFIDRIDFRKVQGDVYLP